MTEQRPSTLSKRPTAASVAIEDEEDPDKTKDEDVDSEGEKKKRKSGKGGKMKTFMRSVSNTIPELPAFLRTLGPEVIGLMLFELLIAGYVLAMLMTYVGTIVYLKPGLDATWIPAPQDTYAWWRGRNGGLHMLTLLESIYLVAPQATLVMLVAGHRAMAPRWAAYIVALVASVVSAGFAFIKFFLYIGLFPKCSMWPDCTDEATPAANASVSPLYFARIAESGVLAMLFALNTLLVYWENSRADAKDTRKQERRPIAYKYAGRSAVADVMTVLLMIILQVVVLVFLLCAMCSVVYPTDGLVISWLKNPNSLGWIKHLYGALHVLTIMEFIYLLGPQAVICVMVLSFKSGAARIATELIAHFFMILSIFLALLKVVVLALLWSDCAAWPDCTAEIGPLDNTKSWLYVARLILNCILVVLFIVAEFLVDGIFTDLRVRHKYWSDQVQATINREREMDIDEIIEEERVAESK
jgi:hypothetical protein